MSANTDSCLKPEAVRLRDELRERTAFEAWAVAQCFRTSNIETTRDSVVPEWYVSDVAALSWRAWQASLASVQSSPECIHQWRIAEGTGTVRRPLVCAKCGQHRLNVQPSPAGQGDAWSIAELVRADLDRQSCPDAYMRIAMESVVKHLAARQPVDSEHGRIDPSWSLHDRVEFALRDAGFDLDEAAFVAESVSAQQNAAIDSFSRQPVDLIAKKVGDYRVTVGEDAITVSHGRDIVFAYSAGDAEPINARQPVGEPVGEVFWDNETGEISVNWLNGDLPPGIGTLLYDTPPVGAK